MHTTSRDISPQRMAWINYRGRLCETLALLGESLLDADAPDARKCIAGQIERHNGYLRQAEKRIAELSSGPA